MDELKALIEKWRKYAVEMDCDHIKRCANELEAALNLQRESQPPKPICCEQCGEEIKNKTYLCSNCWNRICTQRPAQAEAGRPTASAEKRLVAEYARNTPLAAPFQGEQDEWGEGYEAGEASERLKHSDPMLWLEEAFEAYRCLMREVNRRREAAAEQAGIEKGLEMAAEICDGVNPNRWVTGCDAWELSKAIRARKETP